MWNNSILLVVVILSLYIFGCSEKEKTGSIKDESTKTLLILSDALLELQINDSTSSDFGALKCNYCNVLHTRAAEAVFPFSVVYRITKDEKYFYAAKSLGNWLIRQQFPGGEWQETPEEWTGTTTDQLLMMIQAFEILETKLIEKEKEEWTGAMHKAADFLVREMSPEFASINYCATTTATLSMMNKYFPNESYTNKARKLAHQTISKMNEDGFINAEGDRAYGVKYGADVGYEIDMSLWGLGLYAQISNDSEVDTKVKESLKNHLYFVYPNGAIDGSWGIRSNKWTTYGSLTADGCQVLFSMYAQENPAYRTAAIRNLEYLNTMFSDGLIGYGPHHKEVIGNVACNYPTFVRAKNLAMAVEFGDQNKGIMTKLPTEEIGWVKFFPTTQVALIRSENIMTTITAYGYQELKKRNESKYMHRPAGGSVSNLWVKDHGFLQLSNQTEYHRWEPMSFPDMSENCITSRIEFENENGYFTNLYEFNAYITTNMQQNPFLATISTSGEMCEKKFYPGGVAYKWTHKINDTAIIKTVNLRYHDGNRQLYIKEPIVKLDGMVIDEISPKKIIIKGKNRDFVMEILEGPANFETVAKNPYKSVFPAIVAFPITIKIDEPDDNYLQSVTYSIQIKDK